MIFFLIFFLAAIYIQVLSVSQQNGEVLNHINKEMKPFNIIQNKHLVTDFVYHVIHICSHRVHSLRVSYKLFSRSLNYQLLLSLWLLRP